MLAGDDGDGREDDDGDATQCAQRFWYTTRCGAWLAATMRAVKATMLDEEHGDLHVRELAVLTYAMRYGLRLGSLGGMVRALVGALHFSINEVAEALLFGALMSFVCDRALRSPQAEHQRDVIVRIGLVAGVLGALCTVTTYSVATFVVATLLSAVGDSTMEWVANAERLRLLAHTDARSVAVHRTRYVSTVCGFTALVGLAMGFMPHQRVMWRMPLMLLALPEGILCVLLLLLPNERRLSEQGQDDEEEGSSERSEQENGAADAATTADEDQQPRSDEVALAVHACAQTFFAVEGLQKTGALPLDPLYALPVATVLAAQAVCHFAAGDNAELARRTTETGARGAALLLLVATTAGFVLYSALVLLGLGPNTLWFYGITVPLLSVLDAWFLAALPHEGRQQQQWRAVQVCQAVALLLAARVGVSGAQVLAMYACALLVLVPPLAREQLLASLASRWQRREDVSG